MRSAVRRLTEGLVIRRRLPSGARLHVSPASRLAYLKPGAGCFDQALIGWAEEFAGAYTWDIGANVGVFAFTAARAGRVLAVEPDPNMAALLMRSAAANPGLNVYVLAAAVSDRADLAVLQIASGGHSANALAGVGGDRADFGRVRAEVLVPTVTMDRIAKRFGPPDLIKIDVEGAESLVLAGGEAVLNTRPTLLLEVGKTQSERVHGLLGPLGYRYYRLGDRSAQAIPCGDVLAVV